MSKNKKKGGIPRSLTYADTVKWIIRHRRPALLRVLRETDDTAYTPKQKEEIVREMAEDKAVLIKYRKELQHER